MAIAVLRRFESHGAVTSEGVGGRTVEAADREPAALPPSVAAALVVVVVSALFSYPGSATAARDFASRFVSIATADAPSGGDAPEQDHRSGRTASPRLGAAGLAGVESSDTTRL